MQALQDTLHAGDAVDGGRSDGSHGTPNGGGGGGSGGGSYAAVRRDRDSLLLQLVDVRAELSSEVRRRLSLEAKVAEATDAAQAYQQQVRRCRMAVLSIVRGAMPQPDATINCKYAFVFVPTCWPACLPLTGRIQLERSQHRAHKAETDVVSMRGEVARLHASQYRGSPSGSVRRWRGDTLCASEPLHHGCMPLRSGILLGCELMKLRAQPSLKYHGCIPWMHTEIFLVCVLALRLYCTCLVCVGSPHWRWDTTHYPAPATSRMDPHSLQGQHPPTADQPPPTSTIVVALKR